MQSAEENNNLTYQSAPSELGGSYTSRKLAKLRIPSLSGKRFLDLGCNMGFYCKLAYDAGAARVVGVDTDSAVIGEARRRYPGIEFLDTGWDIFPNGQFDVIICLSAIHYARDPIALVDVIRSHLSHDGVFILEGGLIDHEQKFGTDLLVPAWRMVGDRCRHLSGGFIANHLLREFKWKIIGPSEQRGGDDVLRYVIHARPGNRQRASDEFSLDLLEYSSGLAQSAETIVPTMPSAAYVKQLGALGTMSRAGLENVLSVRANLTAFLDDLVFAIGDRHPIQLKLANTVSDILRAEVNKHLHSVGIISSSKVVQL